MQLQPLMTVNALPVYSALAEDFKLADIPVAVAYLLDATGWKLYRRNVLSEAVIEVKTLDGCCKLKDTCYLRFEHKIPRALIEQVSAFFTAIYRRDKSEAAGYLYYNASDAERRWWQFVPPDQTATGASCNYDAAPRIEGWLLAGTIHSHGSMSAFHSGTDHKDETHFDGVHITIGKVDEHTPEFANSIVVQGTRFTCKHEQLIEDFAPTAAIPAAWLAAVKEKPPASTTIYGAVYSTWCSDCKRVHEKDKHDAPSGAPSGQSMQTPLNGDVPPSGTNGTPSKLTRKQRRDLDRMGRKGGARDSGNDLYDRHHGGFFDPTRFWGLDE